MRTFQLEQVNKEIISHAGHALVGAAISTRTNLAPAIDAALPKRHGTPGSDVVKAYLGILTQGKNDFESINALRQDVFFHQAFDFQKPLPTEACIRLRLKKEAEQLELIINQGNIDFLKNTQAPITALASGHIPLDIDVTPHDNSNTQKEQISRTYKGMDSYAPIACYLGQEGWGIRYELRPGKQHSQCEFIPVLDRTIDKHGQRFVVPELTLEGWWTTLNTDYCDQQILALYRDLATSEQFRCEIKTDLDQERLPSGKFDSITLILTLTAIKLSNLSGVK